MWLEEKCENFNELEKIIEFYNKEYYKYKNDSQKLLPKNTQEIIDYKKPDTLQMKSLEINHIVRMVYALIKFGY